MPTGPPTPEAYDLKPGRVALILPAVIGTPRRRITVALAGLSALALLAGACTTDDPATADVAAPTGDPATADVGAPIDPVVEPGQPEANGEGSPDEPSTSDAPTPSAVALDAPASARCPMVAPAARVDLSPTGNRIADLTFDLTSAVRTEIAIDGGPAWVLADPRGDRWYVVFDDSSAAWVGNDGSIEPAPPPENEPPLLSADGIPIAQHVSATDPLPDGRIVHGGPDGSLDVTLTDPTDRYGHGVLGDRIEAAGFEIRDRCTDEVTNVSLAAPDVVEGTSALLGDADGDGIHDILVTLANGDDGARLALFRLDGTRLAESDPIGRGNRWRNQLAIAPTGPDGEIEVIDVRTPHIGGTVQYFRVVDERLERVASTSSDYTTHTIGSRNLDLGIVADADLDGHLDVLVLSQDRERLVGFERIDGGVSIIVDRSLDGRAVTNLAPAADGSALAIGTSDGRLIVFGSPD